jgi:hypothetical protein
VVGACDVGVVDDEAVTRGRPAVSGDLADLDAIPAPVGARY